MAKAFNSVKKDIDSMDRVTFGKHSGNTWYWVMENYLDYIIWCVGNTDMKFSYDLIVDAIKSNYKKKAEAKSTEVDGEYVPSNDFKFSSVPAHPSKRAAHFYDGGLRGDMAHYGATLEQEANDRDTDRWVGGKGHSFSNDWDDDIPF